MIPKQKRTEIPLIGLGTWRLQGTECLATIPLALELGYRHIDTADVYENHEAIGEAIHGWPRKELFITSKVRADDLAPQSIRTIIPRFLQELKTDYLDLVLIHWPSLTFSHREALQTMVDLKKEGLLRAIGVSNFARPQLRELAPDHFPIVTNQMEMHPYLQRRELVHYCTHHGISISAYRPLAKGAFEQDAVLKNIGIRHGKSPSQVALRWLVQQEIVVIPKAANPKHLSDNLALFDFALTDSEMEEIKALDCGKRYCAPEGASTGED